MNNQAPSSNEVTTIGGHYIATDRLRDTVRIQISEIGVAAFTEWLEPAAAYALGERLIRLSEQV